LQRLRRLTRITYWGVSMKRCTFITAILVLAVAASCGGENKSGSDVTPDLVQDTSPPDTLPETSDPDTSSTTTLEVGPAGGTLELPGGGTLEIPAGALAEDTAITVTLITPPVSDLFSAAGPFYEFEPDGLLFAKPATLLLPSKVAAATGDRFVVAWSHTPGEWFALPTWRDAPLVVAALVPGFSQGGSAQWAELSGACCDGETCSFAAADECEGSFVGAGVPCELGGRGTCEQMVCCKASDTDFSMVWQAQCTGQGHVEVEADKCDVGCCTVGSQKSVWTHGRCDHEGGTFNADVDACAPEICCILPGSATMMPLAQCQEQSGEVAADAQCAEVCCRLPDPFFATMPMALCLDELGVDVEAKNCQTVCCSDGAAYEEVTFGDCTESGRIEVPSDLCQQVCCLVGGETALMPQPLCTNGGGTVVDPSQCAAICCAISEVEVLLIPESECTKEEGKEIALAQCDEVCCMRTLEQFDLTSRFLCEQGQGIAKSSLQCEQVCCSLVDGTHEILPAGACEVWGLQPPVGAEQCEQVCCGHGGSAESLPRGDCLAIAGAQEVAAAQCDQVCCALGEEWEMKSPLQCLNEAGAETEPSQCAQVCCVLPQGGAALKAQAWCESFGTGEVPAEQCQELCCTLPDGTTSLTSASLCQAGGGSNADPALCQDVCCHSGTTGFVASRAFCLDMPGMVAAPAEECGLVCCSTYGALGDELESFEMLPLASCLTPDPNGFAKAVQGNWSLCSTVCCLVDGVAYTHTKGDCTSLQGTQVDEAQCADVCCSLATDNVLLMSPEACHDSDGKVVELDKCDEICCQLTVEVYETMPRWQCDLDSGAATGAQACEEVCCRYMGDVFSLMPSAECTQLEDGSLELPESCEEVCCLKEGLGQFSTRGRCALDQGVVAQTDEQCTEVCCLWNIAGVYDTVSPYMCENYGLMTVDMEDCEQVCCYRQTEGVQMEELAECLETGTVESAEQCDMVCCLIGDDDVVEMSSGDCLLSFGLDVGDALCEQVCCVADGQAIVERRGECQLQDGVEHPASWCGEVCCVTDMSGNLTDYSLMEKALCIIPMPGELSTITADVSLCDDACCLLDGSAYDSSVGTCASMGGTVGEASDCQEVCCDFGQGDVREVVSAECSAGSGVVQPDEMCMEVCCLNAGDRLWASAHECEAQGGTVAEDADLCYHWCCDLGSATRYFQEEECLMLGGTQTSYNRCAAPQCEAAQPSTMLYGAFEGNAQGFGDNSSGMDAGCDTDYDSQPGLYGGNDMLFSVQIPADGCLVARASIMGSNPVFYLVDACGETASTCYYNSYYEDGVEPIFPMVYPMPSPEEVRITAGTFCNDSGATMAAVLWFDGGTQTEPGWALPNYTPLEEPGDFRVEWSIVESAPLNDQTPTPIVEGWGATLETMLFATDQFTAQSVPGLGDLAGEGTPDLFYSFVPTHDGYHQFRCNILWSDGSTTDNGHFLALLDPSGEPMAGAYGDRTLVLNEWLAAGQEYTLVVDTSWLTPATVFDVSVHPYLGPQNGLCGDATAIAQIPFEEHGTTEGAWDNYMGMGSQCEGWLTADAGMGGADVVYAFTPQQDSYVLVELQSLTEGYNPVLMVTTQCGAPVFSCYDALAGGDEAPAGALMWFEAGTTYYLVIDSTTGYSGYQGDYLLRLSEAQPTSPDNCDRALEITSVPFEVVLDGRNLTDLFSGGSSECSNYVCCLRENIYDITTSCLDGVAVDDWSMCETVCCSIGTLSSEELRGNCQHYGGQEGCPSAALPVSCCQIFAMPQIAYVYAEGCGMPLQGGVQGEAVDAQWCDQVCCQGNGYQKRGNCENFGAAATAFPPDGYGCSASGSPVGVGRNDALFKYTATEPGVLSAKVVYGGGSTKHIYALVGQCAAGHKTFCQGVVPKTGETLVAMESGDTAIIVADGWTDSTTYERAKFAFTWQPGLPGNVDCLSAAPISSLPFVDQTSTAWAGNDLVQVTTTLCPGTGGVTNGQDLVYSLDPGAQPMNLIVGVMEASFYPVLYALSSCPLQLPGEQECMASSVGTAVTRPHLLFQNLSTPTQVVVETPLGKPWGNLVFTALDSATQANTSCATAITVPTLPWKYTGHNLGAGNNHSAAPQTCYALNFSEWGPGSDVVFKLEVTQQIFDNYQGLRAELLGASFPAEVWLLKDECNTCYGGTAWLNKNFDYKVGDVLYFVVDSKDPLKEGMFTLQVVGL